MGRGRFTLQVKADRDPAIIDTFMKNLKQAGFHPHKIRVSLPGKGQFFRVRIGRFETMEEARAFQRKYRASSGQDDGGFVTRL